MADSQRKTANLFIQKLTGVTIASTGEIVSDANYDTYIAEVSDGETYTVSNVTGTQVFGFFTTEPTAGTITYNSSRTIFSTPSQTLTVPTGENIKYIGVRYNTGVLNAMLNVGSTPLPYEPYGWLHSLRKLATATDTITTLPADLYADGNNATVGLVGNMSQTGTPTPTAPILPQETGDRTGNLFDKSKRTDNSRVVYTTGEIGPLYGVFVSDFIPIEPNTSYTLNIVSSISGKTGHLYALYDVNKNFVDTGAHEATPATEYTFTTPSDIAYIRFNGNMASVDEIMLNPGSTAIPYEPFGYKIPISSANTTTPVYLGEVESTRKIKKVVFKGDETENWGYSSSGNNARVYLAVDSMAESPSISTHYQFGAIRTYPSLNEYCINNASALVIGVDKNSITSAADFKTYLAQQYAAGTPVCVWYVLATPTTTTLNEPLRKIGDYADTVSGVSIPTTTGKDTFDILTTLKPSEVSLTYTGWHDASVKEWDGSQWQ